MQEYYLLRRLVTTYKHVIASHKLGLVQPASEWHLLRLSLQSSTSSIAKRVYSPCNGCACYGALLPGIVPIYSFLAIVLFTSFYFNLKS
jgi:hypothetical protein